MRRIAEPDLRSPWLAASVAAASLSLGLLCSDLADAIEPAAPAAPVAGGIPAKPPVEQGTRWGELNSAQREALKPLEHEWPAIESSRKQKWLELSGRFSKLSPAEQARVQDRMAAWARLTPLQRGDARLRFQQVKQMPAAERQARWEAYQSLTPEQKQEFAARAGRPAPFVPDPARRASGAGPAAHEAVPRAGVSAGPLAAPAPRAIGPTIVQAGRGVTTTSVTKRPTAASHPQPVLPSRGSASGPGLQRLPMAPRPPGTSPSTGRP